MSYATSTTTYLLISSLHVQAPPPEPVQIRGGTTYFSPQANAWAQQQQSSRRVKMAIPIVNPQVEYVDVSICWYITVWVACSALLYECVTHGGCTLYRRVAARKATRQGDGETSIMRRSALIVQNSRLRLHTFPVLKQRKVKQSINCNVATHTYTCLYKYTHKIFYVFIYGSRVC